MGVKRNTIQWAQSQLGRGLQAFTSAALGSTPAVQASRQVEAEKCTQRLQQQTSPGEHVLRAPNSETTGVTTYQEWQKQTQGLD